MQPRSDRRRTLRCMAAAAAAALLSVACVHRGAPFVWVDQLPPAELAPTNENFRLAAGDLVSVQVYSHPEMSGRARVRDDGQLSVPLLGDVAAGGHSPTELARAIEAELGSKGLAVAPRATVALEERAPLRISVIGEVLRPGLYPLETGAGVAEALASAGGLSEFAHRDRIFVLRPQGSSTARVRLRYQDLSTARGNAAALRLRPRDVVVVE